jgi:hypothetical protein
MSLGPDDPRVGPMAGGGYVASGAPGAGIPPAAAGIAGAEADREAQRPAPDVEPEATPRFADTPGTGLPAAGKHHDPEGLSVGELFAEVSRDLSTLLRQEVDLAKAEAATSARRAGKGAGMYGGAAYAAGSTLLFLSIALWWALGNAIGRGWSALVVAVIWAIVAAVLAARGRAEFRRAPGLASTADSLKKIPHALQGHEEKNR